MTNGGSGLLNLEFARLAGASFGLGQIERTPRELSGGRAHLAYLMEAGGTRYVLKLLRWQEQDLWVKRFHASIDLELKVRADGVQTPKPIETTDGSFVAEIPFNDRTYRFRLHEFVVGTHPGWRVDPSLADWAGGAIAVIHRHAIPRPAELPPLGAPVAAQDRWTELVDRSRTADAPWASEFAAAVPLVNELAEFVRNAFADQGLLLWTHGEPDERNVLVATDGTATLIDWDGLWSFSAESELASAVLHWSGANVGEPSVEAADALLTAYRRTGGAVAPFSPAFPALWIAYQLGWLSFAAQMALGDDVRPVDTHAVPADEQVRLKLAILPSLRKGAEGWRRLFKLWPGG